MGDSPFRVEPTKGGARFTFDVRASKSDGHKKVAQFAQFEIPCDEGPALGGDDSAPPPLAYFGAALAF